VPAWVGAFRRVVFSDRLVLVARFRVSFWIIFLCFIRLRLQILEARNLSASLPMRNRLRDVEARHIEL
jgi:hypothetical protein